MSHFWVCVQRNDNRISEKYLRSLGHCSIVHNSRDTETTRASVSGSTDKEMQNITHAENYCTTLLYTRYQV